MNPLVRSALFLIFLALAGNAYGHYTGHGHVHTLSQTRRDFWNPNCRSSGTCDLKRFSLTVSVYEVWFSDDPDHPTYANGALIEYETDSVNALDKYAVVQFKKGCVFHSSKSGDGVITRRVEEVVTSFGEDVPFCFSRWVIDSLDTDPVYNSDSEHGRFYLLRWNEPGSHDERTQKYYGAEKPTSPVVYLTDYPAGAFVSATGVRNSALAFNTCIYKARDVPAVTRRNDIDFAKPIGCLEWQNVYVYDFAQEMFRADWTDVPRPGEAYWSAPRYLMPLFVVLLAALALMIFSHRKKFLGRTDAS